MKNIKLNLLLLTAVVSIGFLSLAQPVGAVTSYTYTCGELGSGDGPSCSSGTWTKASPFSLIDNTGGGGGPLYTLNAGTYYVTATASPGSAWKVRCTPDATGCSQNFLANGVNTDVVLTVVSSAQALYFHGQSPGGPYSLGNICITDTIGGCAPVPADNSNPQDIFWFE